MAPFIRKSWQSLRRQAAVARSVWFARGLMFIITSVRDLELYALIYRTEAVLRAGLSTIVALQGKLFKLPEPLERFCQYVWEHIYATFAADCDFYIFRAGRLRRRSSSPGKFKKFYFSMPSRPALRTTQPSIQRLPGDLFLRLKRQGLETDHLPPTSAEFKKTLISTSNPPYVLMA
jgi:hypothetical protein